MSDEPQLNQKIALITGGSKGIGKAIAHQLAKEGNHVFITARNQEKLDQTVDEITASGGKITGFAVDMRNSEGLENMVQTIIENHGQIDILVNNAGIGDGGPFLEYDRDSWWNLLEINLKGPMVLSQLVLGGMVENKFGIIVNMSSFASVRAASFASAYSVSKTALNRLGDCIAVSVENENIGVFNISPGLVRTDMTAGVPDFQDIPDEYWSSPTEAAELVSKLSTGNYNQLSGRFIHVNYDLEEMAENAEKIKEENLYRLRLPIMDGLQE